MEFIFDSQTNWSRLRVVPLDPRTHSIRGILIEGVLPSFHPINMWSRVVSHQLLTKIPVSKEPWRPDGYFPRDHRSLSGIRFFTTITVNCLSGRTGVFSCPFFRFIQGTWLSDTMREQPYFILSGTFYVVTICVSFESYLHSIKMSSEIFQFVKLVLKGRFRPISIPNVLEIYCVRKYMS